MAESSNIARPYARALFELAQARNDLAGWGAQLEALATIAADPDIVALANNPRVSAGQLQALILDTLGALQDPPVDNLSSFPPKEKDEVLLKIKGVNVKLLNRVVNLVKLLIRNRRLGVLPAIARAYADLRAEAESVIAARMITASEINRAQRARFAEVLQAKLGRKVELEFAVDPELVGGAVVRAGDWVIDGSVRAQLQQLAGAISF